MQNISTNDLALVTGGAARATSRTSSTLSSDQLMQFSMFMNPLKDAIAQQQNQSKDLLPVVLIAALANKQKNSTVVGPGFVATA